MNLLSGMTVFLLLRIDSANHRREPAILELHDHRPLDVRRGRDDAGRVANLHAEIAPIAHDVFGADENVRVEVDHFLPQLAIESGHDRDDKNEHSDAEHHAHHRDERDDGKERALRFEIAQREEKTERQFQIADTVAAIQ